MQWIRRYSVVKMSSDPMYGHDRTFDSGFDADAMIEHAQYLAESMENICVIESRYAGEENMRRGISFDSHIIWADWLFPRDRRVKEG